MNIAPIVEEQLIAPDTFRIATHLPIPSLGLLPVSAFVIRGRQPVLIDTGIVGLADAFYERICALVEPKDLRHIWLTHTDPDHTGNLYRLLETAPNAQVVTTFLAVGKLGLSSPLPPERTFLLNPGQTLDVGDRSLLAVKPATFDAPETTGLFDSKTRTLFSADCFGTLLEAPAQAMAEVPAEARRAGLVTWTSVDAPWLHSVDEAAFGRTLRSLQALAPAHVLSSHAPPAAGMLDALVADLASARDAAPFIGPDQAEMIRMMTSAA